MPLSSRRAIVWVISIVLAILGTLQTVWALDTTLERYGYANLSLLVISYGSLAWIWLDYFMKTDMLQK